METDLIKQQVHEMALQTKKSIEDELRIIQEQLSNPMLNPECAKTLRRQQEVFSKCLNAITDDIEEEQNIRNK